jgi:hypothetical protein
MLPRANLQTPSKKDDPNPYDTAFKEFADQDPELLPMLVGALPPGAKVKPLPRAVSISALLLDQPYYDVISGSGISCPYTGSYWSSCRRGCRTTRC